MTEDQDLPSNTPLDLLINAIAGSSDLHYPSVFPLVVNHEEEHAFGHTSSTGIGEGVNLDGFMASRGVASEYTREPRSPSPRRKRLVDALTKHVIQSAISSETNDRTYTQNSSSSIEVWHPTTAQKSYGKERRILNPPPILRLSGPLLPSVSSVTLSSTPYPVQTNDAPAGTQTHRFHLTAMDEAAEDPALPLGRSKRARPNLKRKMHEAAIVAGFGGSLTRSRRQTDGKDRERLQDGLTFPALWVGEEAGKRKESRLELKVSQPGEDAGPTNDLTPSRTQSATVSNTNEDPKIDSELDGVLSSSSMAVLQPLAEAVQQANEEAAPTLADFTAAAQPASSVDRSAQRAVATSSNVQPTDTAFATFLSSPLKIVSKPSQKTAKARSMASCFARDASFALWTRIHAQTVRTKYMKLETDHEGGAKLTSKTAKWTPFRFDIIERAMPPAIETKSGRRQVALSTDRNEDKLTYGSIVRLVDLQSGIKSDSVKLVKVESDGVRVGEYEGHPVSELQRIGLVRIDSTGSEGGRWFLSAPGARLGGGEIGHGPSRRARKSAAAVSSPNPATEPASASVTEAPESLSEIEPSLCAETGDGAAGTDEQLTKRRKTKRNALAAAVLAEDEDGGSQTLLEWTQATVAHETRAGSESESVMVTVEKVEDWMSWIIGGVSSFAYTFFGTDSSALSSEILTPIDPIPRILIPPTFHSSTNTLDLTLSQFHFPSNPSSASNSSAIADPLEIYLGPIGPLHYTLWRSSAPALSDGPPTPAVPYDAHINPSNMAMMRVMSSFPADVEHVIVVVQMPDPEEIIRTMQDCVAQAALDRMHQDAPGVSANIALAGTGTGTGTGTDVTASNGTMGTQSREEGREKGESLPIPTPWFNSSPPAASVPPAASASASALPDTSDQTAENGTADELTIAAALNFDQDFSTLHQLEPFNMSTPGSANIADSGPALTGTATGTGTDPDSKSQNLATAIAIDPALHAQPTDPTPAQGMTTLTPNPSLNNPNSDPDSANAAAAGTIDDQRTIGLTIPPQKEEENEMVPLPLFLVRKDGMVFGTGRSVAAQKIENAVGGGGGGGGMASGNKDVRWGLKVVQA